MQVRKISGSATDPTWTVLEESENYYIAQCEQGSREVLPLFKAYYETVPDQPPFRWVPLARYRGPFPWSTTWVDGGVEYRLVERTLHAALPTTIRWALDREDYHLLGSLYVLMIEKKEMV